LNLTQAEVASRIKTSTTYVAYLESGKRHPSNLILTRLAKVLRVVQRELFLLANPQPETSLFGQPDGTEVSASVWDQFQKRTNNFYVFTMSQKPK
jgi:transcriptional regulator with XRE-family HTH domain